MRQTGFAPVVILITIVILALGGYLIYKQYTKSTSQPQQIVQSSPSPIASSTPMPAKTNSLNPNTGNLYTDIKVRLNTVLK